MVFQMLFYLVDLYFVAQLGDAAVAGVSAAANATLIVLALSQVLGVGTVTLIAHAVGRCDQADANLVFNQSAALSAALSALALPVLLLLTPFYMASLAADEASARTGAMYLYAYAPGLVLQFVLVSMSSALRGTGIVQPTMGVQMLGVLLNVVLAPILIAGWGTGWPLGVVGAGLASSLSIAACVLILWIYFRKLERYVAFDSRHWRPRLQQWRRILDIGLPAGGELAVTFLSFDVIYRVIGGFGADAQAGIGIGMRLMQLTFLPVVAIASAAGAIVGQNFGAGNPQRVRETVRRCLTLSTLLMAGLMLVARWRPDALVAIFTSDAVTLRVGAQFLSLISLTFIAQGAIFTCSSVFQGLGNVRPALLASGGRLIAFSIPALWMSTRPDFRIEHVWYLAIFMIGAQAAVSLWLLRSELQRRLTPLAARLAA
jgi:putative MATE family efflux protein